VSTFDQFIDYVLHLDVYLTQFVDQWGAWVYAAIAATIFAETGLVVMPWLPGESLLVTSGTLAGSGILNIFVLAPLLFVAAFLGDVVNFLIGRYVGRRWLRKPRRFPRPDQLERAEVFYEQHGGAAIILGRFLPVVRTLAPFVAGIADMPIKRLMLFAVIAEGLWVAIFLGAGYWFGTAQWVQDYLALALGAIVVASLLPGLITYLVRRLRRGRPS
jgi:membrane-associated protein